MKHKSTRSHNSLPKNIQLLSRSNTQPVNQQLTPALSLKRKKLTNVSEVHLPKINKKILQKQKYQKPQVQASPAQLQLIAKIRQKSTLLGMLKKKIIECGDNIFVKRVLSQIRFTSIGKIAIQMWNEIVKFQECDFQFLTNLEQRYNIVITEDFTRTMDFINNVCRFLYADYKKKRWNNKEKDINNHFDQINQNIQGIQKRIKNIQKHQTKVQIVSSLYGLKRQCFARKQCYVDWKQRAIQKLKEKEVKDVILRAQIFTQNFY